MSLETKEFVKNQVTDKQKDRQEEDEVANKMEILEELLLPVKLDQKDSTEDLSLLEEEEYDQNISFVKEQCYTLDSYVLPDEHDDAHNLPIKAFAK
jgi:hypothetical protein